MPLTAPPLPYDPPASVTDRDPPAPIEIVDSGGTLAPLANKTFRWFWIASLISNIGTWVHEVGAGWLMTSLDADPAMVSAVRIAISLPMILLAIPAGGIIDRIDRKAILIVTTIMLFVSTSLLTWLTYQGTITAWALLWLTFSIGVSMVGHMLAWQSVIPELVPRVQLSRAVALGSISFNLARAIGPALGGVLIAVIGTWTAFGFNAASFAGVLVLVVLWQQEKRLDRSADSFYESLKLGLAFSASCLPIRSTLANLMMFVLPASCLWALLPLYVRQDLGGTPKIYGLLVTLLGCGAVTAAMFLHRSQSRFGFDRTVAVAMMVYGTAILILGTAVHRWVAPFCLIAMGSAWMMTLTTLNSTMQLNLPSAIRGRGMSLYVTGMSFSMATGAFVWGRLAKYTDVPTAMSVAGAVLLVNAAVSLRYRLQSG